VEAVPGAGAPPVTDIFGVVAHPVRRQIAVQLGSGDKAVRDLAVGLSISRPAVSQHLRVMLDVGVVSQRRVGRENRYRLQHNSFNEIRYWLAELDSEWANALTRLREHLERNP
jgi:DNA-binding transcriptional ArsR family regulator